MLTGAEVEEKLQIQQNREAAPSEAGGSAEGQEHRQVSRRTPQSFHFPEKQEAREFTVTE